MQVSLSSLELLKFFQNSRWQPPLSWIFRLCEFDHSAVLIVWYLSSVPNLVQTVIATEINFECMALFATMRYINLLFTFTSTHLCFRRSFDDVTRINFRFRLLVRWSSPHARDASSHKIWCIYLYPIRSYWHFSKLKMAVAAILDLLGGRGPCKILPEIKSIHQSATFITNPDWKKLRLWSLEDRCVRADLIKVYKIVNGLSSVKFDVVFSSKVWYLFRIFIL